MTGLLQRFLKRRDGIAAAEFAIILPVLILILFGTAEIGNALLIDRKVTRATQVIADLVAQEEIVSTSQLDDIMQAADEIMRPFPTQSQIVLSSVWREAGESTTKIAWSVTKRGSAYPTGTTYSLPSIVLEEEEGVIVAELTFPYEALFPNVIFSDFTIRDRAYLRPRKASRVEKS
ncbi:MAG: pilus assembly protein [Alphaproteobacteria bacterium]